MSEQTTRERILNEAERSFIALGIHNTQMKDLAETVGINRRTLYRYFATKEDLAFAVEIRVLDRLKLNGELDDRILLDKNGYEKIVYYFETVELDRVRDLLKYTAEFDRYFQDEYPSPALEAQLIETVDPRLDPLYRFVEEGCADGSLRQDIPPRDLYMFISQNLLGFFQRLVIREKHLAREHCENIDFQHVYKTVLLQGIREFQ